MSIEQSDKDAAAVAVAPRVSLADIEAAISFRHDFRASSVVSSPSGDMPQIAAPLDYLSVCFLVMKNGFTVIGKSAPASPENFNAELGKKFAYEDCIRQLWPLMGFNLRERLYWQSMPQAQQTGA
jgi:hypothetical protein